MDFQAVAAQLRKPEGDFGKKIGENMSRSNEQLNKEAIALLQLQPHDKVLEIGMGNGTFCADVVTAQPHIHYTGCDFSETMIAEATQINQKWIEADLAKFLLADVAQLPLANESISKVFTVNTLYFWENPSAVLAQIHRVLKPSGKLVIGIRSREVMQHLPFVPYGFQLYTATEVKELLLANGFSEVAIQEIAEPAQEIEGQSYAMDSVLISGIR